MAKRLTRKKLKQKDEFLTVAERIIAAGTGHKTFLIIIAISLIFIGIFSSIGFYYYKDYTKRGSIAYSHGLHLYDVATQTKNKNDINNALNAFEAFRNNFNFLNTSKIALFYIGNCEYLLNNYDKAISDYQEFISTWGSNNRYLISIAKNGIIQSYMAQHDCKDAMPIIQELINQEDNPLVELTYLHATDCLLQLNQPDKAVTLLQQGIKKYSINSAAYQQLTALMTYAESEINKDKK
ncbi:MAG: tetratricopeptide repeat protein [Deltaproteobacteria bacterium]|nr:tetratricopeptide repeat protein [Deltaproteobacteria bacterium]MCL5793027.1 tetratricopeptide repeat protein [Deltaproteobacteria bacterium]